MKGCFFGLHDLPEPPCGQSLADMVGRFQAVCMNCDKVFAVKRSYFGARWVRIAPPPWAWEGWRESGSEPGEYR